MEAFSDGVFATIITIMVLELRAPHGSGWGDLLPLVPVSLSYLLSFIFIGIYFVLIVNITHKSNTETQSLRD